MDQTPQEHRLERLNRGYKATGLPLTAQRRALLEVLAERQDHPTVDQVYEKLAEKIPEVSRTTVYRSLETLAGLGLLKRVEHPGASVRFDPNAETHNHFLCALCGSLTDLPDSALSGASQLAYVDQASGQAEEISVLIRGRCRPCLDLG